MKLARVGSGGGSGGGARGHLICKFNRVDAAKQRIVTLNKNIPRITRFTDVD